MSPLDVERLLWELAADSDFRPAAATTRIPDDDTLRAFRDGALNDEEAREVETALAANWRARERLAAVAGVDLPAPDSALREAILDRSFPAAPVERSGRWWPAAAAFAAAAMLATALSYPLLRPPTLPAQVDYQVSLTGLAAERSASEARELVHAFPETRIRISVEPVGVSVDGLEIGLYRQRELRLQRLIPDDHLRLETYRGAGLFEAAAEDLVGLEHGIHSLYVVVAKRGDLPPEVVLKPGEDPQEAIEKNSRRRAYARRIQVESSAAENGSRKERER